MQALKRILSAIFVGTLLLAAPALHADAMTDNGHGHWDKFDMLKKQLGLTEDQVSQWKAADKSQMEAMKLLGDQAKADLAELAVLVDQKASDEVLTASLNTLMADHKAIEASKQKQMDAIRAILTPMQQAKLVGMMYGHSGHRGGMGGGWKDGPGGMHGQGMDHGGDGAGGPGQGDM
ncbi:MAG TPA: Spy/CpxP family protein refolding chaperone [bacterium]|nr:Spy/CpxP family protein refolding chaperone [bacterium]